MADPLTLELITSASVGGAASYVGSLMITRRMALVGDALGHVALPGVGLALLLGLAPAFGAFVFLFAGILLIWKLRTPTALATETLVGIVFVTSIALGFLIVPQPDLLESLIGDLSKLSAVGSAWAVVLSIAATLLVRKIYPGLLLSHLSQDLATAEGIQIRRDQLLFLVAVALVVSIGIQVTGTLLIGALVIVPPATARILSHDLKHYSRISALAGILSALAGVMLSSIARVPLGPAIILSSSAGFACALGLKRLFAPE